MPLLLLGPLLLVAAVSYLRGGQLLSEQSPREPWLSTSTAELAAAGGTVGGALGTAVGAVVGSIIPGAGTVVGAAAVGSTGAAIGAAVASATALTVGILRDRQQELIEEYQDMRGSFGGQLLQVRVGLVDLLSQVYDILLR